jgi:hypothetical protein
MATYKERLALREAIMGEDPIVYFQEEEESQEEVEEQVAPAVTPKLNFDFGSKIKDPIFEQSKPQSTNNKLGFSWNNNVETPRTEVYEDAPAYVAPQTDNKVKPGKFNIL